MINHPPEVETRIEDATRVLAHYFKQAMPDMTADNRQDLHAEMRDVVVNIMDAAILLTGHLAKKAATQTGDTGRWVGPDHS